MQRNWQGFWALIASAVNAAGTLAIVLLLTSCSSTSTGENLLDNSLAPSVKVKSQKEEKLNAFLRQTASQDQAKQDAFKGFSQIGNDQILGAPTKFANGGKDELANITLNLVAAPIPQAAKAVLGDTLGFNYSVDARVQGNVTLQTSKPVSRSQLMGMFQQLLRDNGAALVGNDGSFRIIPLSEAAKAAVPLSVGSDRSTEAGYGPQIFPLRYVSANNMSEVLTPMLPPGMLVHIDAQRNALVLSGTSAEIEAVKETISIFDVDWMRGMSFALVPIKSSSPGAIVQDLEQVFQTRSGPLKGILRFVPNERLKSVLVISSRAKYLRDSQKWIKKMDVLAQSGEASLHVYHIQNRNATDLANILAQVFDSKQGDSPQSKVAPKFAAATTQAPAQIGQNGGISTGGLETPATGIDVIASDADIFDGGGQQRSNRTRVVADDANNALLVYCSDVQFEKIRSVLIQIDSVPNQVLLEAVIAEVSLDDDMKFGVRWFLGNQSTGGGGFSDAASGAASSVFPGFSYFLKANDIAFSLNAISSVTHVRVLSAPSMVVLDNKKATLQVGDQVPIVTQTAQGVGAAGAPIVSNVELKDTGVILNITPRVNDSGVVTLDIEQQVSSVTKTTTSGIDSPTIQQRKLTTSVVVNDNEAIALGGLIQERENTNKTKVPVFGDIPILGAVFRQKQETRARTELIMFIRPLVIRNMNEARQVTAEFRKQLSIEAPHVPQANPKPGDELTRIFN